MHAPADTPPQRAPLAGAADLVDAGFVLALAALALIGFRTTYTSADYLVTGLVAALLGVLIAQATLRVPVAVTAVLTAIAFFAFGGVLVLREQAVASVLPGPDVLRGLVDALAHGWKQLLTTLPPVARSGPLLIAPYVIGLATGALGHTLARRTRSAALPALAPTLALAAVILLGVTRPAAHLLQGAVFACVALCWITLRARRHAPALRHGAGRRARLALGVALVAVAGVGGALVGPHLPGGGQRVVLRSYVAPPFDISHYPSPLVGFRKYTKDANLLYDQTLFTVRGLPKDRPVRIATLDGYDGSVWGATNGTVATVAGQPRDTFQRVGARITTPAHGTPARLQVTIGAAYAASRDVNAWLPGAGTLRSISFAGPHADSHAESFRYNLATGAGIVADRLRAGDSYTLHTLLRTPRALPAGAAPFGEPTLPDDADAFVASRAAQWSGKADGVVAQVAAVARYMRDHGAYSDGGPGEGQYLPGHSRGRLTTFLNGPQLVGDDEQYAAAFALICNNLGLPARVVLDATPAADGTVKGKDVHADVEVHIRSDEITGWALIDHKRFMPDESKKPDKQPPQTVQDANAAVVPPPNPVRPPSTLDQPDQPEHNTKHVATDDDHDAGGDGVAGWLVVLGIYGGLPIAGIILLCLLIVAVKGARRHRRRTRGSPTDRFARGWRELLDHAVDLGAVVPAGYTRGEQARLLSTHPSARFAAPLAPAADAGVFGRQHPPPEAAAQFWARVGQARSAMSRSVGRGRRLRAALSLRTFRRRSR